MPLNFPVHRMQTDSFWTVIRDGLEVHSAGQEQGLRIPESFSMTLVSSSRLVAQSAGGYLVQDTGLMRTSPSPSCRYIFYNNRHTWGPMLKHLAGADNDGLLTIWKKGAKAFLTPHTWRTPG